MTADSWSNAPNTVHVNGDWRNPAVEAGAAGGLVRHWSLAGIRSRRQLGTSAAEVFEFPFPSASLAGLIDMLSDLEWLDTERGVLLVIDATGARESIVEDVAMILPYIGDRWRSGSVAFEAYLIGVSEIDKVAAALETANGELDEAGRVEWSRHDIYRVPVVIHP